MAALKRIVEVTIEGGTTLGELAKLLAEIPDHAHISVGETTAQYSTLRLEWS